MTTSVGTPSDEVLRKVGRNVFNLQRLEAALKALVLAARVEGPLADLVAVHSKRSNSLRAESLGKIADRFHKEVFGSNEAPVPPKDIGTGWVSTSFQIEIDPAELKKKKAELRAVVRERNQLIHHKLLGLDLESAESCNERSTWLDDQNARICVQLDELHRMGVDHAAAVSQLAAFIESEQFARALNRDDDA